jgi:glucose/arabinose dehydrogenase
VGCGSLAGLLPSAAAQPGDITLPPGFQISVHAGDVPNARQMAAGPDGIVFVGSRSAGKVYAVVNRDGEHHVHVLASGLNQPSGLAFRDGSLYVAAVNRILRFPNVARDLERPPKPEVVSDAYPSDTYHGWKFIAFGPDGRLYVPVGAPCNVCLPPGPLHSTITRLDIAGGRPEVVARGVRNSVGFDFQPETGELWFTDNGRDWLGDDQPPDELSRRRPARPRAQRGARVLGVHGSGPAPRPARRSPGHALLWRSDVSRSLPGRHLHRRARLLEPVDADRLPRHLRQGRRRSGDFL